MDNHDPDDGWEGWETFSEPPIEYDGPPPHFEDSEYYDSPPAPKGAKKRPGRPERQDQAATQATVLDVLRRVLAAQSGKTFVELGAMVREVQAADKVLETLGDELQDAYKGVLEALLDLAVNCEGGVCDLRSVPTARLYDARVQDEMAHIAALVDNPELDQHPSAAWFAVKETVQRSTARSTARLYLAAIEGRETVDETVERFKKIEPPTTRKAATRTRAAKTAAQVVAERRTVLAGKQQIRLSSGFRTLDIAFTSRGEPLGFITPGEGSVVAGPTGTGKSSWTYGTVTAMAQDLCNWGLSDAKIIWAHTEEESYDKVHAAGLDEGQGFHHLSESVVVANIGTSRQALAMTIYDCVAEAHAQSIETGRPIDQFLPYALVLDYIQSVSEQGETEVVSTATTAEFLLRGVQAWNPEEMSKFCGLSYREYTGAPWPEGMEHHRIAGIYMAQLVKQDDKSLLYRPGARDCQLSDFALEDTDHPPAWLGPDGNGWSWEVKEGDLRLFKQNAIRGSGVILQNATSILILHRSRAYNNPKAKELGEDGRPHLEDLRARFLLDKTRTGTSLKFVPMHFDLDAEGFRARYVDVAAEEAIRQGKFAPHEAFTRSGDPILPIRQVAAPLAGIRY